MSPVPEARALQRPDGITLRGLRWLPLADDARPPQHLVLLHGLGEHVGRHQALAAFFATRGFTVHAFDHRGHGRSDGPRGGLRTATDLIDDTAAIVDACGTSPTVPVLLFGHSMGGLVALCFALRHPGRVAALLLSSPALAPGLNAGQKWLLALMSRIAPDVAVSNGLDPAKLSHDEQVVRAYLEDPLVHDRITARLARFIVDASRDALERAAALAMPTLLLYAGDDRLVDPQGSRDFAARAPPSLLVAREYPALWHEIFNEAPSSRAEVFGDLAAWLDRRAASAP